MSANIEIYLGKAYECLTGAESEFANGRYNNCANRCYYACFQAAIVALGRAGIAPDGGLWGHAFVQAQFVGQLINRRHLYPTELHGTLAQALIVREQGDYKLALVSQTQAAPTLGRARAFVVAIAQQQGGTR
jgi:uncharacterized protein (UPF0332 family)